MLLKQREGQAASGNALAKTFMGQSNGNMSQLSKPACGEFGNNDVLAFFPAIANRGDSLKKKGPRSQERFLSIKPNMRECPKPPSAARNPPPGFRNPLDRENARIALRSRGKILLLDPREIIAVEAQGNYVMLRRQNDSLLLRESISLIAEKLRKYGLLRIHRSVLVNKFHVEEVRRWPTGEYGLRLKDGKEYTLTRTYKAVMEHFADLWL